MEKYFTVGELLEIRSALVLAKRDAHKQLEWFESHEDKNEDILGCIDSIKLSLLEIESAISKVKAL